MWEPVITFILLSICLVIFFIRQMYLPTYCKFIGIVIICHLIFYSFTAYLMFKQTNNMILFHVLRPLQYALMGLYFIELFNSSLLKRLVTFSIPTFIFFSLFFSLQVQGIYQYNSYSILIYNFLIIVWVLLFFKEMLDNTAIKNLLEYPAFWISIGLLFYCVGTTFSEGLMNYLVQHQRKYALSFYYIGIVLSFFLYFFIMVSFICDKIFKVK